MAGGAPAPFCIPQGTGRRRSARGGFSTPKMYNAS
nr:MAG TPA_asm: hypothetical protein [Caudoviricetes sp.]